MEKARVTICVGTACYVLGGAETIGRIEELKELFGDEVTWEGEPCMGLCKVGKENKAPFASVNGKVVEKASLEAIAAAIREVLPGKGDGEGK